MGLYQGFNLRVVNRLQLIWVLEISDRARIVDKFKPMRFEAKGVPLGAAIQDSNRTFFIGAGPCSRFLLRATDNMNRRNAIIHDIGKGPLYALVCSAHRFISVMSSVRL